MRRLLTAIVAVPLLIAVISKAPAAVLAALVAVLAAAGYRELHALAAARAIHTYADVGAVFTVLFAVAPCLAGTRDLVAGLAAALVVSALVRATRSAAPLEQALASAAATVLGALWTGHLMSYLLALRLAEARGAYLYAVLVATWLGDSAAYYVGSALGRHKLAPRLSPGKTVEGLLGGLVFTVAGLFLTSAFFALPEASSPVRLVGLGLALGVAGVAGDLAESALKRGAGVKDSGVFFPGHGGVLDRLDSLLFAGPVMYHYLILL